MRRLILLLLLSLFAGTGVAHASCPATLTDCPTMNANNANVGATGSFGAGGKYVIHPTLYADGVTSDDANLQAAITACTAAKGSIRLPPGNILLTGAVGPITLQNCSIYGAGQEQYQSYSPPGGGTQILLTSTTVRPFTILSGWGIDGVVFIWPNQTTGTTVYPPLFQDDGVHGSGLWWLNHVTLINAYDGFVQTCCSWNAFLISNSRMWAAHDLFALSNQSDSGHLTNMHFSAGNWMCGGNLCSAGMNAAFANGNTLFHVKAPPVACPSCLVQVYLDNAITFSWRNLIKIDAGGVMGPSMISGGFDGIGTVVDATNGTYPSQAQISGVGMVCGIRSPYTPTPTTAAPPCFILNASSTFRASNIDISAQGDVFDLIGGSVSLRNSRLVYGGTGDGREYYGIYATSGSPVIILQNDSFRGDSTVHTHGINSSVVPTEMIVQDTLFSNINDVINSPTSTTTILTGDASFLTTAVPDVVFTDTAHSITWGNNSFTSPPLATVSACGAGASVTQSTGSGQISVGSPGPVTACTLTLPFSPRGLSNGNCVFTASGNGYVTGFPSGLVWTLAFSGDFTSKKVNFSCPGVQ